MSFQNLGLIEPILKALETEGYSTPTPIQAQAIPQVLERRDLLGCAQTGTGKTAAFSLPVLQLLHERKAPHKHIRALVLTPTRELAIQIVLTIVQVEIETPIRGRLGRFARLEDLPLGLWTGTQTSFFEGD